MMVTEIILAVLSSLVTTLTEDFLGRRRDDVSVSELQNQVVDLMADQHALRFEIAEARVTVLALTRYLAFTHGEAFVLNDDRLRLVAEPSQDRRQVILGEVISDFDSSVRERVGRRAERRRGLPRPASPRPPGPASSAPRASSRETDAPITSEAALEAFFDGFDEEVLRARLGQGEHNG